MVRLSLLARLRGRHWSVRLHTNSQDRAAGVAINRHSADARAEPALSLIATGDGDRHYPGAQDSGWRACVDV
jgi:hypothetical protein